MIFIGSNMAFIAQCCHNKKVVQFGHHLGLCFALHTALLSGAHVRILDLFNPKM